MPLPVIPVGARVVLTGSLYHFPPGTPLTVEARDDDTPGPPFFEYTVRTDSGFVALVHRGEVEPDPSQTSHPIDP